MSVARRLGTGLLFAAAFGAQVLLQQPLGHANEVRASRTLQAAPASLAFRLAAGGVKEAAGDALWLTVLPRLSRPWVDPRKKGVWIEGVTSVMIDANPRALNPVLYGAWFLERIEGRHPGIERVVVHAIEAKARAPFRDPAPVNRDAYELPEILGMNMYMYGKPQERASAVAWLREAAGKPRCPTIIIDFITALRAKEGSPLEGWDLWILRSLGTENPQWRKSYLRDADRARLSVLRRWAEAVEKRLGRWPSTMEEVLAEAPEPERDAWARFPARRDALVQDVLVHPSTRDIEVASLTGFLIGEGKETLRLLLRHFELTRGKKATGIQDLDTFEHRPVAPPPLHGTRWDLDAAGEPVVVHDMADPRLQKPPTPEGPRLLK